MFDVILTTVYWPNCALHHAVSYLTIFNSLDPPVRHERRHGLPDNLKRILTSVPV